MKLNKLGNLVRSPDDASGSNASEEVDPLAEAAGAVDTSFPLLTPDRPLRWECISSKIAPTKSDPTRSGLTLILKTTTETTFQNGKKAHPGFKVYKRYGITVTPPTADSEGRSIDAIKKDLSFVLKAFFGPKTEVTARDLVNRPDMLEGKMVDGKTTIEKGSGGFADKTSVTFMIPAGE